MIFTDAARVSSTRKTEEGYLIAEAFAVRTGIQLYAGDEVDPDNEYGLRDRPVVRVYRSEKEVRDVNSLRSFSHAPITIGHPKEAVTAANWKDLAVGEVSTEATWEDNKIKLPLIFKDARAAVVIDSGVRELSAGYRCQLVVGDGVSPEGETYDAAQTNIRINHLAIVPKGRAGEQCRIDDAVFADHWGAAPLDSKEKPMSTKPVVLGDSRTVVQVAAEDAAKVEAAFTDMQAKHAAEIAAINAAHDKAMGAKDAELSTLGDQLKAVEAKVLSDAQIDERAAARAALFDSAKKLAPTLADSARSLSDAELRRAVLVARLGDAKVKDKSDDWCCGVFDSLALHVAPTPDPVITHRTLAPTSDSLRIDDSDPTGYNAFTDSLVNGWKQASPLSSKEQ